MPKKLKLFLVGIADKLAAVVVTEGELSTGDPLLEHPKGVMNGLVNHLKRLKACTTDAPHAGRDTHVCSDQP